MVRWTILAARWYLHYFPVQKGKGSIYDFARGLVKRAPEAFQGMIIRSAKGFYWRVDTTSLCLRSLLLRCVYSPEESRVLESILAPGDVFVDIGAHAGYFSVLASSLVGEGGNVLAFEPAPSMQELFRENLALNKLSNVRLFPYAASNESGQTTLFLAGTHAGASSLRSLESATTEEIKVETVLVDQCLEPEIRDRVKLVKLDIEGAELLALKGMRNLLERENGPDVMCEVTDRFLRKLGGSEQSLLMWMEERGYHAFRIEGDELEPVHKPLGVFQYNVLFSKRQHVSLKN